MFQSDFERAERLLDRVKDDKQTDGDQAPLKETLQNQISEQERLLKDLQEVNKYNIKLEFEIFEFFTSEFL